MSAELLLDLANGVAMPAVAMGCAFGNWTDDSQFQGFLPEGAWRALEHALDAGYRSFDGAHAYGTEAILGSLLGKRFAAGQLQRSDVFVTTKLAHPAAPPHINISHLRTWNAKEVPSIERRVVDDFMRSLDDLKLGYVDLLLMHWPGAFGNEDAGFARIARKMIWEAFVALYERGACRALGVSNFTTAHLEQLLEDVPEARPVVNQVEVHPYCRDHGLEDYCRQQEILVTAYAPLASGAFGMLQDPVLVEIARRNHVTVGQTVLRWHLQHGRAVLPKSSNPKRLLQNLELPPFELAPGDMAAIDQLGSGPPQRTCPDPNTIL